LYIRTIKKGRFSWHSCINIDSSL